MRKRERLLRIRPLNMANFSGGYGYMPVAAIFGFFASFAATFLLWAGMALPLKKENGSLDYQILKRRLNHILLPICLVLFVPCVTFLATTLYGSILAYGLATIWAAAVLTIGMYCSIYFSAMLLNSKGKLSFIKWLLLTLLFLILLAVLGFFILLLLIGIGHQLEMIIMI